MLSDSVCLILRNCRYAQQARKIVNDATINEDPNAKLVRELRAEIDRLRMQFGDGRNNMAEVSTLRDKLSQTQALMTAMNRSWEEKLRLAEKMRKEQGIEQVCCISCKCCRRLLQQATTKINNKLPNLVNLNEDPQLSEMLIYMLEEGIHSVQRIGLRLICVWLMFFLVFQGSQWLAAKKVQTFSLPGRWYYRSTARCRATSLRLPMAMMLPSLCSMKHKCLLTVQNSLT